MSWKSGGDAIDYLDDGIGITGVRVRRFGDLASMRGFFY
jgi:hypothetical protein